MGGLNIATPCYGTIPDTAYKIDGTSDTTYFLQAGKTLLGIRRINSCKIRPKTPLADELVGVLWIIIKIY